MFTSDQPLRQLPVFLKVDVLANLVSITGHLVLREHIIQKNCGMWNDKIGLIQMSINFTLLYCET